MNFFIRQGFHPSIDKYKNILNHLIFVSDLISILQYFNAKVDENAFEVKSNNYIVLLRVTLKENGTKKSDQMILLDERTNVIPEG